MVQALNCLPQAAQPHQDIRIAKPVAALENMLPAVTSKQRVSSKIRSQEHVGWEEKF